MPNMWQTINTKRSRVMLFVFYKNAYVARKEG